MEKYVIVYGSSPSELTKKVNEYLSTNEWFINGSHQVVVRHTQNRYRGDQHIDSQNELEYSQNLFKKN